MYFICLTLVLLCILVSNSIVWTILFLDDSRNLLSKAELKEKTEIEAFLLGKQCNLKKKPFKVGVVIYFMRSRSAHSRGWRAPN